MPFRQFAIFCEVRGQWDMSGNFEKWQRSMECLLLDGAIHPGKGDRYHVSYEGWKIREAAYNKHLEEISFTQCNCCQKMKSHFKDFQ